MYSRMNLARDQAPDSSPRSSDGDAWDGRKRLPALPQSIRSTIMADQFTVLGPRLHLPKWLRKSSTKAQLMYVKYCLDRALGGTSSTMNQLPYTQKISPQSCGKNTQISPPDQNNQDLRYLSRLLFGGRSRRNPWRIGAT